MQIIPQNAEQWFHYAEGLGSALVIGAIVACVAHDRRHPCTYCGSGTDKECYLWKLPPEPKLPHGKVHYLSYIFRRCRKDQRHIDVTCKHVYLTPEQELAKPEKEFNWTPGVYDLCKMANIRDPRTVPSLNSFQASLARA